MEESLEMLQEHGVWERLQELNRYIVREGYRT